MGEALAARRDTQSADMLAAALRVTPTTPTASGAPGRVSGQGGGALGAGGRVVAPELVAQLRRPETPPAAATQIARALASTGAEDAVPALRDFLTHVPRRPVYDADPTALIAVAEALLKLGGPADRSCCCSWPRSRTRRAGSRAPDARARRDGSRADGAAD